MSYIFVIYIYVIYICYIYIPPSIPPKVRKEHLPLLQVPSFNPTP